MKGPSQWLRPVHESLLGLVVGLGVAFVLAVGLGAGIAIVTQQGSLPLPEGAEPLQADATTTSIEAARREDAEISGPSEGAEEAPTGDHNIGVWYVEEDQRWTIFNEDGEEVPEGAAFNVTVFPLGEPTFVQRANSGNITQNWTSIDDPLVNGDPNAILIAIPRQREG